MMKLDQLIENRDILVKSEAAELISDGLLYSAASMEYVLFIIDGLSLVMGILLLYEKNCKKYGAGIIVFGTYPP